MDSVRTLSLNGIWRISQVNGDVRLDGRVPGLVHQDLIEQKLVDNPFFRMNELSQQWIGDSAWDYEAVFDVSDDLLRSRRITLEAEGVDLVADLHVNDKLTGSMDNLFIRHRIDVRSALKRGKNKFRFRIHPALAEAERRSKAYPYPVGDARSPGPVGARHRNFIRTCQCQFGWDWAPCLATPGFHRDMTLVGHDSVRILYLRDRQRHSESGVDVVVEAVVEAVEPVDAEFKVNIGDVAASSRMRIAAGESVVRASLCLPSPELWWPNGHGAQRLYDLCASIVTPLGADSARRKIGFREIKLVRNPDAAGESFCFQVNGIDIFAKGANWIPADAIETRVGEKEIEWALTSAVQAGHNMVRVWGGGQYERDSFYDACDRLGLMVWQDFMFAKALYPTSPEFLQSVYAEITHQIHRLAHHPSIVLWCGSSEGERVAIDCHRVGDMCNVALKAVLYDELCVRTIQPIVEDLDSDRPFWPSSPSTGVRVYSGAPLPGRGDTHEWSVWDGSLQPVDFLKSQPRFVSEFGFQSFPSPETMAAVTLPDDRNIGSEAFEHHQRAADGNLKIASQTLRHFRAPKSYDDWLYISQALQALIVKTTCEQWRRAKPHTMGILLWNLDDCWPGPSCSSLEYDGRWKMLHYFERKFFAPLLLSTVESAGHVDVWVTSDIDTPLDGILSVELMDFEGATLFSDERPVSVAPLDSRRIGSYPVASLAPSDTARKSCLLNLSLAVGARKSDCQHFFAPFRLLNLRKPTIFRQARYAAGKLALELRSDTLAPFVWIRHGNIHGVWSDNGMNLLPNRPIRIDFTPRDREATLREFEAIINIHDLYNSGI